MTAGSRLGSPDAQPRAVGPGRSFAARHARLAVPALLVALLPATVLAERLAIRTFNSSDGLGSSFVNHILQDSQGYVWFATRDGLSRWNGYEFTTLANAGLPGPAVDRVYQTRSGEYFVIANDGSLYSWRPRTARTGMPPEPTAFHHRDVLVAGRSRALTCLYEDSRGRLWGGGQGLLIKGVGTTNTPIRLDPPDVPGQPLVIVRALVEDRAGTLWVGTNWGLFRLLANGELRRYTLAPSASGDIVSALALDAAGRVWIGHRRLGVVVLQPAPAGPGEAFMRMPFRSVPGKAIRLALRPGEAVVLDAAKGLPDNGVTCILPTASGHVWVGTDKGLARFDGAALSGYTKEHGLCDNLIYSLCEGGDGSLWVSTPTGAMRVVLDGFSRYTTTEGLATDHVVAFRETPGGGLHAIGVDWSINTLDRGRFRARRLPLPAGSTSSWASQAVYLDSKGRWWALARQGLYRFDRIALDPRSPLPPPDRVYTAADGLPSASAFRVFEDRSGALWVGTRSDDPADAGLARFGPDLARATPFGETDGLPPRAAPSAFVEDRTGTLWIGFYQGGLARCRNGRLQVFGPEAGVPAGAVTALLADSTGRIWVGTNLAGLGRIDRPSADRPEVRVYSTRDGLASNNVRAVVEDRFGRIYAGSARGVDRLEPDSGRLRHFSGQDGLISDFITAAFRDARGDLWFGTFSGAFHLSPRPDPGEEPPPIALTGLRISGAPYPVMELGETTIGMISLGPDRRDIEVDYVSVARRQAAGLSYQYSIGGGKATWSPPTRLRTVSLARLEPGHYVFAVRAITSGGAVSPAPATFEFTIRPPFYRRWWFLSLALAASAAILLAVYRYRVERLLEVQRLRLSIASDLHDDVAANLSSIATFSELLRGQTSTPSPLLDRVAALAGESVEAIREIIWSIDPKPESVGPLLVRLRDAMVISCRAQGMRLTVSVPPAGLDENLTPEQRKNIWLMLKEAVTNASRHSGGTEIRVTLAAAGRGVRITVQDDGRGCSLPARSEGRGLSTMKARAEALGGSMELRTHPGQGTTVEFQVPLAG